MGGGTKIGHYPDGEPMHLQFDCYSNKLKVLIEYDGPLHFYTDRIIKDARDMLDKMDKATDGKYKDENAKRVVCKANSRETGISIETSDEPNDTPEPFESLPPGKTISDMLELM